MPQIAINAVAAFLTTVGVPATIATPIATFAVSTAVTAGGNAALGCCAPLRSEGAGEWLEDAG